MTPREMNHEIAALRVAIDGIAGRLAQLYNKIEWEEKKPREIVCPRCREVARSDGEFPDKPFPMVLKVEGESILLTPVESGVIEVLLANKGKVVTWDKVIFNVYESELRRPWVRDDKTEYPKSSIQVTLVYLRRKLKGLPVSLETRRGVGLILDSEVPLFLT